VRRQPSRNSRLPAVSRIAALGRDGAPQVKSTADSSAWRSKPDASVGTLRADGFPLPNLFAGGGSARGLSGPGAAGTIAGNGLLAAAGLGRVAGSAAAPVAKEKQA
jgi:hypothetical protein